jgi:glycosyltransferase involved in cell wall biosynthesis
MSSFVVPKFSIVTLTRNEQARLPTLLASITDFLACGGELIVADSGSSDQTRKLAEKAGCKVVSLGDQFRITITPEKAQEANNFFEAKNIVQANSVIFNFSGARNAAAENCTNNFVLVMDAGDRIEHLDVKSINNLLEADAVFPIVHYLGETNKHNSIRFYDRRAWQYVGQAHEHLAQKGHMAPDAVRRKPVAESLLKMRYYRQTSTVRNYIYSLYLDMLKYPQSHRWCFYLGRELFYIKKWTSAIKVFSRGMDKTRGWTTEISQGLCYRGQCWVHLGDLVQAERDYLKALDYDASRREGWIRLAYISQARKNYAKCKGFAYAAMSIPRSIALYENEQNYICVPHDLAYWAEVNLKELETGYTNWKKCLTTYPTNSRFIHDQKFFQNQIMSRNDPEVLNILFQSGGNSEKLKSMPLVIGIVGEKFAGKTTLTEYLIKTKAMTEIAFAEPIKEQAGELFNLTHREKFGDNKEVPMTRWNGTTPRNIFQAWGDLLRTDLLERLPAVKFCLQENKTTFLTMVAKDKAEKLLQAGMNVIFSDVRHQDEFELVQTLGGVFIGLVRERPNAQVVDLHDSEVGPRKLLLKMNGRTQDTLVLQNNSNKAALYSKTDKWLNESSLIKKKLL